MKHHSLLALLFVSATSVATPCRSQSPVTGGSVATRLGGVLIRITEVPFDRPDYVNRAEREIQNRFRHAALKESLTAQVAARIRRDGTIDGARVVTTSGDSAFDNRARAAMNQASADRALGPLPDTFPDSALPVLLTFRARQVVNLATNLAAPASPAASGQPYFEFQVTKPVRPVFGAPDYPDSLRRAGVSGEVIAQFVVDTSGLVDTTSLKVLRSSHPLFSRAVAAGLSRLFYDPAEVAGRKVKQVVQQPFTFSVTSSKDTSTAPAAPAARSSRPPKRPAVAPSAGSPSAQRPPATKPEP